MGTSFCRFVCGTPDWEMGDSSLHDGEWEWPDGLAHYVERHSVRLPDEFINTMRSRDWRPAGDIRISWNDEKETLQRLGYFRLESNPHWKSIGFWRSNREPALPEPKKLASPGWYGDDLPQILAYLRGGRYAITDYLDWRDYMSEIEGVDPDDAETHLDIPKSDVSFWMLWAERQGAILPVVERGDNFPIEPDWLVSSVVLEESLLSPALSDAVRSPHHRDLLTSQISSALQVGGQLWRWQSGEPERERGAAAGLAVVQDGRILCAWWLRVGWLAEHIGCAWIRDDGTVREVRASTDSSP